MDAEGARRIERMNYYLGAILIGVAIALCDTEQILGMVAGVVISCLNFTSLRRIATKVLNAPEGQSARPALLFFPQMIGLMAAVALSVYFLPLSPIFVAIGFSVFMVSIGVETARFVMTPVIGS